MTKNSKIAFAVLIVITAVSLVTAIRQSNKVKSLQMSAVAQGGQSPADIQKIVSEVSKHIVLPETETPTMAMVSDLSKLKGQPFFERTELGDIVLIYGTSRRAVLWRPSAQKIIEVSAINISVPPAATESVPAVKK